MALSKAAIRFAREKLKKLNERAKRESAAAREKIPVRGPFDRIRQMDPEPTRHAQDKRRSGR